MFAFKSPITRFTSSGPYALITASLVQYFFTIPSIYKTKVFGVLISDKFFTYMLAFQLSVLQFPHSFIPMASGLVSGLMYKNDVGNIALWRFPAFFNKFAKSFAGNIFMSNYVADRGTNSLPQSANTPYPSNNYPNLESIIGNQPQNISGNLDAASSFIASPRISENIASPNTQPDISDLDDQIAMLQAMFPDSTRERIIIALQSSNYDPNVAASSLLEFS
ncbi:hypothetical protein AYI69_g5867 [Smittium culicis]|uniref:CUE domain-containing protein n=1 Tax=Smittium culicis TaxID=133412 RepID=A0A1R1Y331_9FUNG|nr:hypothetical protein AYI69_g5867 [Smittium culicis]